MLREFVDARRQLQARLQELEITSTTSSTIHSGTSYSPSYCCHYFVVYLGTELREALESYKAKAETYMGKLETAEIARSKAARAEAFGTFQLLVARSVF